MYAAPIGEYREMASARYQERTSLNKTRKVHHWICRVVRRTDGVGGRWSDVKQTAVEPDFLVPPGVGLEPETRWQVEKRMNVGYVIAQVPNLDRSEEIRGLRHVLTTPDVPAGCAFLGWVAQPPERQGAKSVECESQHLVRVWRPRVYIGYLEGACQR